MLQVNDIVFFGRALENFQDMLLEQSERVFEQAGIIVPVRSCSLLVAIKESGSTSASDLSRQLGYSHQLVLQKIPKLKRLDLIKIQQDPNDGRRRIFKLTQKGAGQVKKLEVTLPAFATAYKELFKQVGDIQQILSDASTALEEVPLEKRIQVQFDEAG